MALSDGLSAHALAVTGSAAAYVATEDLIAQLMWATGVPMIPLADVRRWDPPPVEQAFGLLGRMRDGPSPESRRRRARPPS